MVPPDGDELHELETRLDPRLLRALDMVAPGTPLREGIDSIIQSRTGGLILIAEADEVSFLFSGGIKLDIDYTPGLLYQVAKMDGAIVLDPGVKKICWANVQLMPDPTILSMETGTRHRTAERVSKQTNALVISISERREVVSLYIEGMKCILQEIPMVLSKANQGLATLEKYRSRLDQLSARLTNLEFMGSCTLHDVLSVLQRAESVTRMAAEVERYIISAISATTNQRPCRGAVRAGARLGARHRGAGSRQPACDLSLNGDAASSRARPARRGGVDRGGCGGGAPTRPADA